MTNPAENDLSGGTAKPTVVLTVQAEPLPPITPDSHCPAADDAGWSPIESAPKDGTWFVALQNGETFPCEWHATEPDEGPGHEGWWDHFNQSFEAPTHWTPAAQPPSEATHDGEDR